MRAAVHYRLLAFRPRIDAPICHRTEKAAAAVSISDDLKDRKAGLTGNMSSTEAMVIFKAHSKTRLLIVV